MVDVKTVVVSVVAVLSFFLQPGMRPQPTIHDDDDVCSQLEDEIEFQAVENAHLRSLLESERQAMKILENVSYSRAEENDHLNVELEKKQQKIETLLENVSSSRAEENHPLNMELEKKQQKIETLENVSSSRADENHQLNMELEKKQQKIETLENVSSSRAEEKRQLNMELENKQQKLDTLENVSYTQTEEIHRLNLELENMQHKIDTLGNVSNSKAEEIRRLDLDLKNKQQNLDTLENVSYTQAEEIHRLSLDLENEQQKIDTLGNISNSKAEEIRRLNLELVERRRLRARQLQSVTATFITSFDHPRSHTGITKVEDKIYVLSYNYNAIRVYEDLIDFRFMTEIALSGTNFPFDIAYSNKSKCVYIRDINEKCIWVMTTTGEHRLTKWLNNVTKPNTLSLSNEGHLLVLRQSQSLTQDSLEIYSLNATLIRSLQLPQDIKDPRHVVQTSAGNFIISHRLYSATYGRYVISQLTNDGQLINRFIPRNQSEELIYPDHLSLDSDNNLLFVADFANKRVLLFDSCYLTWSQVLLSQGSNGIKEPSKLFYDASKKYLFVGQHSANVTVYEIN